MLVKGESRRFPGKNFQDINGTPLWKINALKMQELGVDVCIVTDGNSHEQVDWPWTIKRPIGIPDDSDLVMQWFAGWLEDGPLILMQATNPNVDVCYLEMCKHAFENGDMPIMVSINPHTCKPDGSVYFTKTGELWGRDMWVIHRGRLNHLASDIDTLQDFYIAEAIYNGRVIEVQ